MGINNSEAYSGPSQTSKMELFPKIVNGIKFRLCMLPPHYTRCSSSTTNAPPPPLSEQCAKWGFAVHELPNIFEKMKSILLKKNEKQLFVSFKCFFHME